MTTPSGAIVMGNNASTYAEILPYSEQSNLYNEFNFNQDIGSSADNSKQFPKPPADLP